MRCGADKPIQVLRGGEWGLVAVVLKIRGKGAPERFVRFLRTVLLVTAHAHDSPECRARYGVQRPHSPAHHHTGASPGIQLEIYSVNGEELTADHMIKAFADAENLEPQKARPYLPSSPSPQRPGSDPA